MITRPSPRRVLYGIAVAAFLLRLAYVFLFVDLGRDDYWEYGEIARNLHAGKGYALFHLHDGGVAFRFHPEAQAVPSAFMPPAYVAFLYPYLFIQDVPLRNLLILGTHALFGAVLVLAVFQLTKEFFQERAALTAAGLAAFMPEFVYASGSFTPTVLYHLLVILLLWRLYLLTARRHADWREVALLVVLNLSLMYLRSETVLLVLLTPVLLARAQGWKRAAVFVCLVAVGYAPWSVRNITMFDRFVPMTTSGGLNLFRGHNLDEHGAWSDPVIDAAREHIPMTAAYEPALDSIFRSRVWEIVRSDPGAEADRALTKLAYLWLLNPREGRAWHPLYVFPWVVILISAVYGVFKAGSLRHHLPVFLFLVYSTLTSLVFFVLPRYQTMMKVALLPFAAIGLVTLWRTYVDFPRRIS